MSQSPIVSVCMITYAHENFIREAIAGVLMQECNFELELIIANDASPDNTDNVIQSIIRDHPRGKWIKYFKHEKNIGMMPNFIHAMQQCRGKYIALCEGDDYWTDPLKLQKQVDFLEINFDYTICFHKVQLYKKGVFIEAKDNTIIRFDKIKKEPITVNDLLEQGNFIHTPSVMFRNQYIDFPFEFQFSPVGDYFLYIILSQNGFIKRLDDTMAVYRVGVGIYSSLDNLSFQKNIMQYQSCILSYLSKTDQKEILLKRQLKLIDDHFIHYFNQLPDDKVLLKKLSLRKILELIFLKIVYKFKRK